MERDCVATLSSKVRSEYADLGPEMQMVELGKTK